MNCGREAAEGHGVPSDVRFAALYERHYRLIRDYCRRRVPAEQVDDVVAETFLTAWRRLEDVPVGDEARWWLYRVAFRIVGHHWRSDGRRRRLESRLRSMTTRVAPPADDRFVTASEHRLVLEAAGRLESIDLEVLRLREWDQLSVAEIAAVLDLTPNAAKQRLHRARRHLAEEYWRIEDADLRSVSSNASEGTAR